MDPDHRNLRADFDLSARVNHRIDLFDLAVRNGDTAPRPVIFAVAGQLIKRAASVNKDISTRALAQRLCLGAVRQVGV